MPNHFHLMAYVHSLEFEIQENNKANSFFPPAGFMPDDVFTDGNTKIRDLNNSIGLMLRSYTRAIHEQENKSGSLFRKMTKANSKKSVMFRY